MLTALRKIYDFAGNWQGVLKKSVAFSLLHSIFDMFQIAALFLILIGLTEGMTLQIIVFTLLLLIISILGKIYCSYISDFSQTKVGYYMCAEKRIHVGDRMKYMPMGYFNDHSLGKLTSAVTTTIGDVENNAPSVLITVVHGFVHVVVITIVMFFFDWRIGSLCCLGILLFLVCNSMMQKKSQKISPERQRAQEDLVGATLEYIQGMNIVKSFNLGGNSNQKMKQAIEESRVRNTKLETVFIPYGAAQQFVLRLISVSIMFCSILFYLQGSMTLVYCLLMCVASFLIFSELEKAGGKSFALRLIESSIDKINEIDETPIMDLSGQNITPPNMDIELKDVSFSYGEHQIFRCINLSVPSRTTLAIVGPSGSGKTTLCSLIARFWDVQSGSITLGGTDIRDYTLDKLLSNFSIVFQNVYLFADTIENNIRFGKPDASHDEVVRVAKKACCHDFIMALPQGYDTVIGESGATLSGGEKQRISIARAILKDAPIVILDEATSSVDPENESDLQAAIESLTESKTVITIAHRLKTVKNADQIVVIADGKITQRGTHEQLKMQSGIYADFINIRHKATGWKLVQ
jgi:ATP-binding cassette subfamily B protein IrtB